MPSILSVFFRSLLWVVAYRNRKHTTQSVVLDMIAQMAEKNARPVVLPMKLQAQEEYVNLVAGQVWQVLHQPSRDQKTESNTVVVFWHGGGWVATVDPLHLSNLSKLREMNIPVVLPVYTLAPFSTGVQTIAAAIDLLVTLCKDPKYVDKEIVIMGDSAGGWISLRLILAFVELVYHSDSTESIDQDELVPGAHEILTKHHVRDIKLALDRIRAVVLCSAAVDMELAVGSDRLIEKADPMLRMDQVHTLAQLWTFGPGHFPGRFADLPAMDTHAIVTVARRHGIDESMHSPANGIEVLSRYDSTRNLKIVSFCGDHDILHPSNQRLAEKFYKLNLFKVDFEFHSYPGMFHVFMGLPFLPESRDVWRRIESVLIA